MPMETVVELKPCPFCGSMKLDVASTNAESHWIECEMCGAQAPSGETLTEGVALWNSRRPPQQYVNVRVRRLDDGVSEKVEE